MLTKATIIPIFANQTSKNNMIIANFATASTTFAKGITMFATASTTFAKGITMFATGSTTFAKGITMFATGSTTFAKGITMFATACILYYKANSKKTIAIARKATIFFAFTTVSFVNAKKTSAQPIGYTDVRKRIFDLCDYFFESSPKNNIPEFTTYPKAIVTIFEVVPHVVLFQV